MIIKESASLKSTFKKNLKKPGKLYGFCGSSGGFLKLTKS